MEVLPLTINRNIQNLLKLTRLNKNRNLYSIIQLLILIFTLSLEEIYRLTNVHK